MPSTDPAIARMNPEERRRAYWRENMRMIVILLVIWFAAGYLHPPFAKILNETRILTGFPLGYWLASQGSLIVFVILIFFYAWYMNNVLDPKYGFNEEDVRTEDANP
jgi:putative solute:sodium symporter small subunit